MHIYQIFCFNVRVETDLNPTILKLLKKDCEAQIVLNLVASARQVQINKLLGPARGDLNICLARQMAMYLINVVLPRSLTYTGELFARDRRTVSHACGRIEDLREQQKFERAMSCLERTLLIALNGREQYAECG